MPTPRAAVLTAVFLVMAAIGAPPGRAAQREDPLDALRRQAAKARSDLEAATARLQQRQKDLTASQAKLQDTLRQLAAAETDLNRIRGPLASLANATYQQQNAVGALSVFGGGSPEQALRSSADVDHLAADQRRVINEAGQYERRRAQLASAAQDLQSRNAVEQTKVQQQVEQLKQKSADLTRQLTTTLNKLDVNDQRRLEMSCDKGLAAKARTFPNGLIPAKYLCPLPQKNRELRPDAALSFYKLNAAYKRRFGRNMCLTDSYRSLAEQQRIYAQRPAFAAVPGTSNHGKGQAVDVCGGVQNQGSPQFNWLEANSRKYGWFHPAWAYSNPFEPWHWEFGHTPNGSTGTEP
ncbi:D-alanyl-D-alanine carboxypeptidase [Actinomadura rubteroloni]|uniref:D-alanyl-D-alanine carboxypeptidase n=1 Tax=Actinomadura rubteroloni TaxID=1926885 RepID=A0A2P4UQG8_9ACTN|nr:D-alanyl-D-alanine carboxypeptidase family protein [Actinomadura rubteroloni]POM27293.1 D-alanyl-D-alanine carboxypeptidase [Actinomadura rubteroloni]